MVSKFVEWKRRSKALQRYAFHMPVDSSFYKLLENAYRAGERAGAERTVKLSKRAAQLKVLLMNKGE